MDVKAVAFPTTNSEPAQETVFSMLRDSTEVLYKVTDEVEDIIQTVLPGTATTDRNSLPKEMVSVTDFAMLVKARLLLLSARVDHLRRILL